MNDLQTEKILLLDSLHATELLLWQAREACDWEIAKMYVDEMAHLFSNLALNEQQQAEEAKGKTL
jgi:hypothetical protein